MYLPPPRECERNNMKPKLFIGSSVEGLNVAYAIQQNLTYDAESTVWDQGVFELSRTTIESLNAILDKVDFGVFIFSPDDVVVMRGQESSVVRDNVLFELGLFIGKLGRDRVFFIIPDGSEIHLPTDLLGVTPGKYNPNREDKSIQAATGVTSNQIRTQIQKLGLLKPSMESEDASERSDKQSDGSDAWVTDFVQKDYKSAIKKLEAQWPNLSGDELLMNKAWHAFINTKINEKQGVSSLLDLVESCKDKSNIQQIVFQMLAWAGYEEKAIEMAEKALTQTASDNALLVLISDFHVRLGDSKNAIEILSKTSPENDPALALALIKIYKENNEEDKAASLANAAYLNAPGDESLMYSFARLLQEQNRHKEALFLLSKLTESYPDNSSYFGYLSNSCLNLDLYENAMTACKKAVDLSKRNESWLLNNVGNMLNNRGFYSDAISWFNEAMAIDSTSQYGHDRLSKSIKSRDEEYEKFKAICLEGRKLVRAFQLPAQQ